MASISFLIVLYVALSSEFLTASFNLTRIVSRSSFGVSSTMSVIDSPSLCALRGVELVASGASSVGSSSQLRAGEGDRLSGEGKGDFFRFCCFSGGRRLGCLGGVAEASRCIALGDGVFVLLVVFLLFFFFFFFLLLVSSSVLGFSLIISAPLTSQSRASRHICATSTDGACKSSVCFKLDL